jgi:hypothetical protein
LAITTETNIDEVLAEHYAADMLYKALLEIGEPAKASDIVRKIGHEEISLKLARVVLSSQPKRFVLIDRKWTLWNRFADPTHSTERILEHTIANYGSPMSISQLASEMSAVFHRSVDYFMPILARLLSNSDHFFSLDDERYALKSWLLNAEMDTEEDVLFDNFLQKVDTLRFEEASEQIDPSSLESIRSFLDAVDAPVPNLILQFLVWKRNPAIFDARSFFTRMFDEMSSFWISKELWIGSAAIEKLCGFFGAISERVVDEKGDGSIQEAAHPLVIGDEEKDQLVQSVQDSDTIVHAAKLLESVFEITPEDSTYEGDLETVNSSLKSMENIQWVGSDRFIIPEAIPQYIFTVPEILHFPVTHFLDQEGNEVDLLLEDDGFDGGLQRDILSALAQDVLDEELAYTPDSEPPATARCVLKFHHKEIGTFPLCQLPAGFFPIDSELIHADLVLPNGQKGEIWINNNTRLIYGLLDWYSTLPVDSGAVFYLERQMPNRYVLTYGEETEASMFISRNRVSELVELGNLAENEEMPTFEILRSIMEHYRKGIDFITLLTETNIARRTTRRMVASLLSSYHCFFQRGGAWVFDQKKLTQGFDKSKRKYLKK